MAKWWVVWIRQRNDHQRRTSKLLTGSLPYFFRIVKSAVIAFSPWLKIELISIANSLTYACIHVVIWRSLIAIILARQPRHSSHCTHLIVLTYVQTKKWVLLYLPRHLCLIIPALSLRLTPWLWSGCAGYWTINFNRNSIDQGCIAVDQSSSVNIEPCCLPPDSGFGQ